MTDLLIDAIQAKAIVTLTCGNGHDFDLDLSTIDELELNSDMENESNNYMWHGLDCPECDTHEIQKIDLGEIF